MLTVTTIYGLLFAILAAEGAAPAVFAVLAMFVAAVGLGQVFLFKGAKPREASLIAGSSALFLGAGSLVLLLLLSGARNNAVPLLCVLFAPAVGAALGYLVGGAIAGPFFIAKRMQQRRQGEPPDADSEP